MPWNTTQQGTPGWLSWLSVWLQFGSWSWGLWVLALHQALCWQLGAWNLLQILCVCVSLPLPGLHCLSKINKYFLKRKKYYSAIRWKKLWVYYWYIGCNYAEWKKNSKGYILHDPFIQQYWKDKTIVIENRLVLASTKRQHEAVFLGEMELTWFLIGEVVIQTNMCVKIHRTVHQNSWFYCMFLFKISRLYI